MIETIGAWVIANLTLNPVFIGWTTLAVGLMWVGWGILLVCNLKRHKK